MPIVAEFGIPIDALPGGSALEDRPDARIRIERIVPTNESAIPYFWVHNADPQAFLEGVRSDPEIADVNVLTEDGHDALFEATWTPEADVIAGIERLDATLVEGVGTSEGWTFQVRAKDRARLDAFRRVFSNHGIGVQVNRIYDLADAVEYRHSLTPAQREALQEAHQRGYFEEPREITQEELGDVLDISGRAVSDRLRRGTRTLVAQSLFEPDDGTP